MLITRVNAPLQIWRGIFVRGEIIQKHTIHESNCTVIKQPRNGYSKTKKINRKTVQFTEVVKHNQWVGCIWWFLHRSSICGLIQLANVGRKTFSTFFKKTSVFGLDDYQFWEFRFTQICCANGYNYFYGRSEMTGYSFLVVKKSHKLYFEKSSSKLLSVSNSEN